MALSDISQACCVTAPALPGPTNPTATFIFHTQSCASQLNTSRFRSALPLTQRLFETAFSQSDDKRTRELALPGQPAHLTSSWSPSGAHIQGESRLHRSSHSSTAKCQIKGHRCVHPRRGSNLIEPKTAKQNHGGRKNPTGQLSEGLHVATDQT